MKRIIGRLLAAMGISAAIASVVPLYWWLIFARPTVTGNGVVSFAQQYAPTMATDLTSVQLLLIQAREYFVLIGGAIGWLSLLALLIYSFRNRARIPNLVVIGCLLGVMAAAVMVIPYPASFSSYALPPVAATVALLLRAYLASPNKTLEADAPESGVRLS